MDRSVYPRVGGRMYSSWLGGNMVIYPEGLGPANVYFVDSSISASGDGLSWERAFKTVQEAMDAITARGALRGRSIVLVAPGGYTEDIVTPLNTIAPFGALIAVNPTERESFGATWITAATPGGPGIKVRARGWLIEGFEIDALADAKGIMLDHKNTSCSAQGTEIAHCLLVGQGIGLAGIDVIGGGAPLSKVHHCGFYGFHTGASAGKAIMCSESGVDQPRFWKVEHCWFGDSDNLIAMNPRGFKESQIRDCSFYEKGANYDPLLKLDNRGGNGCLIGPNNFLSDTYDHAGGYYAGSNETWRGNHTEDSDSGTTGTGQANPAA